MARTVAEGAVVAAGAEAARVAGVSALMAEVTNVVGFEDREPGQRRLQGGRPRRRVVLGDSRTGQTELVDPAPASAKVSAR